MWEAYVASLHWSLTQFTPSTNNVAPANSWERLENFWFRDTRFACKVIGFLCRFSALVQKDLLRTIGVLGMFKIKSQNVIIS